MFFISVLAAGVAAQLAAQFFDVEGTKQHSPRLNLRCQG